MSERPWMKFYPADYLGDTQHLTTEQHGAYLLLLMAYWTRRSLPTDEAELARIAKLSPHLWKKHREVLGAFFFLGWKHKRIEHDLSEMDRRSRAASAAGIASARQRALNGGSTKRQRNANH